MKQFSGKGIVLNIVSSSNGIVFNLNFTFFFDET